MQAGEIDFSSKPENRDGDVPQGCHDSWCVSPSYLASVLSPGRIPAPLESVFNAPVPVDQRPYEFGFSLDWGQRGDDVKCLGGSFSDSWRLGLADDLGGPGGMWNHDPGFDGSLDLTDIGIAGGLVAGPDVLPGRGSELIVNLGMVDFDG